MMAQPWLSVFPSLAHRTCWQPLLFANSRPRGASAGAHGQWFEWLTSDDERDFGCPSLSSPRVYCRTVSNSPPAPLPGAGTVPPCGTLGSQPSFLRLEWEAAAHLAGPGSRAGQDSPGCPRCSGAGSGTGWSPPRCSHPRRGAQPCGAGMSYSPGTRRLGSARHGTAQPCGGKLQLCHGVPVGRSLAPSGQCRVAEEGMKEAGGHADTFFCI